MRKLTLVFLLPFLFAGAHLMAGESWTGHISDSKCGASHADHSKKSISCVEGCVGGGEKPVFVTEDKKVVQIANPEKVMGHLGHQVKVKGKLKDGILTIKEVKHLAP